MKPHQILYLIDPRDNVATALDHLSPGCSIPVWSALGEKVDEIIIRTHVPRFFKVSVKSLGNGEAVVKWGRPIGRIPDQAGIGAVKGEVVHRTDLIPSASFRRHYTPILDAIFKASSRFTNIHPFELGVARKTFEKGDPIYLKNLLIKDNLLDMLAQLGVQFQENTLLGSSLRKIRKDSKINIGKLTDIESYFPLNEESMNTVMRYYQFMEKHFYAMY